MLCYVSFNYHHSDRVISVLSVYYHPSDGLISVLSVYYHPSDGVTSVMSVNYRPSDIIISVLSVNYYPSGTVISIKSELCIPCAENNFPPVGSAPAKGTQYAAANFNLSHLTFLSFVLNSGIFIPEIHIHGFKYKSFTSLDRQRYGD